LFENGFTFFGIAFAFESATRDPADKTKTEKQM